MFDLGSRYANLPTVNLTDREGRVIAYVGRRFLPHGSAMPLLVEVRVAPADRLDLIAARTLGDPEHFWRICDANDALDPWALIEEPGRPLRVPVPQP